MGADRESRATPRSERSCGDCALCCVVLRVDELGKPAGAPCRELHPAYASGRRAASAEPRPGGCGIHSTRPSICRGYRCAWLAGHFEDADRPDRLGAVLDFTLRGVEPELSIIEASPGAFERSPRLQAIAAAQREVLRVRITDVAGVDDPDRPVRVLLARGEEHRVRGDRGIRLRDGVPIAERRLPWLERTLRRALLALRRRKLDAQAARARDSAPRR
jgi:hypothetical protein